MPIARVHSFLVHPSKNEDEQPAISGTLIARQGRLYEMLTGVANTWATVLKRGVSAFPAPLPTPSWRDLYSLYDDFVSHLRMNPQKLKLFDDTAKHWQHDSGLQQFFSGYFSPYFRDTTNTDGRDNKRTIQFCEPYYRYLYQEECEILTIEPYRLLVEALMSHLLSCLAATVPLVSALEGIEPALYRALIPTGSLPPVALRLISYAKDGQFATNPHVDKSALTMIANTDDADDDPRLVFGPTRWSDGTVRLSEFVPVRRRSDESLVLLGAAPREAGFSRFLPAPHAVRPICGPVRHVAIFFWLMHDIDLEKFDTTIPYLDDLEQARRMAPKSGRVAM